MNCYIYFSGSWTSYAPSCILIDCGEPLPLDNGRVYKLNSTTINSVIEHHCLPGFERDGPFERVCLEDGYWSGVEPSCQKPRPVLTIFRYIYNRVAMICLGTPGIQCSAYGSLLWYH